MFQVESETVYSQTNPCILQTHLKTYILMSQTQVLGIWLDAQIGHLHTNMMHSKNTQKHVHLEKKKSN